LIRLGSNSPTRALILRNFGIDFIQNGGDFDEDSITTTNPKAFCYEATKGKFNELYKKYGIEDIPLLVADSVVTCEGKLLRKAKDLNDAKAMLELQSGNKTSVITCMIYKSKAGAIMVEGFCKPYIKNVVGYESCAMGLCVEKLKIFL
jgi:septum formation protein